MLDQSALEGADMKVIKWEKYQDPFLVDSDDNDELDEFRTSFNNNHNNFKPRKLTDSDDDQKILMTPHGIIPLTHQVLASKKFNFWIAHTNFKLTEKIYKILEDIDGVETLNFMTPYRFMIGFGKLFDQNIVKEDIDKTLKCNRFDSGSQFKAIIVSNNQILNVIGTTKDDLELQIKTIKERDPSCIVKMI